MARNCKGIITWLSVLAALSVSSLAAPALWADTRDSELVRVASEWEGSIASPSDWYRLLSSRWRDTIKIEWVTEILAGYRGTKRDLLNVSIRRISPQRAVVTYSFQDRDGDHPFLRNREVYLVEEGDHWLVDNPFGPAPEWAVSADDLALYRTLRELVGQLFEMQSSNDDSALKSFVRTHFAAESLAEKDAEKIAAQLRASWRYRVLTPIAFSLDANQTVGLMEFRTVRYGCMVSANTKEGAAKICKLHGFRDLVHEADGWKLLDPAAQALGPSQLVSRFLQLWCQGDLRLAKALIMPDATLGLAGGPDYKVTLAQAIVSPNEKGDIRWLQKEENAEWQNGNGLFLLKFKRNLGSWKSGLYEFSTRLDSRGHNKITAVREVTESNSLTPTGARKTSPKAIGVSVSERLPISSSGLQPSESITNDAGSSSCGSVEGEIVLTPSQQKSLHAIKVSYEAKIKHLDEALSHRQAAFSKISKDPKAKQSSIRGSLRAMMVVGEELTFQQLLEEREIDRIYTPAQRKAMAALAEGCGCSSSGDSGGCGSPGGCSPSGGGCGAPAPVSPTQAAPK